MAKGRLLHWWYTKFILFLQRHALLFRYLQLSSNDIKRRLKSSWSLYLPNWQESWDDAANGREEMKMKKSSLISITLRSCFCVFTEMIQAQSNTSLWSVLFLQIETTYCTQMRKIIALIKPARCVAVDVVEDNNFLFCCWRPICYLLLLLTG